MVCHNIRPLISLIALLALAGCASDKAYRPNLALCPMQEGAEKCAKHALLSYGSPSAEDYRLGFVEVDDQGQLRDRRQLQTVLDSFREIASQQDVLLVTYVHGWHHNAHFEDENVQQFSSLLAKIGRAEAQGSRRKVLGLYLGWRGESIPLPFFKYLTFWERKGTAHEVGTNGVAELLLKLEEMVNVKEGLETSEPKPRNSRMVVIGHSFGGAVVFTALQQILEDRFVDSRPGKTMTDTAKGFGDLVVLMNPAFEALRYASLYDLSRERCTYFADQLPRLAILTSEADWATGLAFPAGRFFSTLFESHNTLERIYACAQQPQKVELREAEADRNTVGHFEPFLTHTLHAATANRAASAGGLSIQRLKQLWIEQSPSATLHLDGTQLVHLGRTHPLNPYLNIRVDAELIPDHNEIWDDRVVNFIADLIAVSTLPLTPQTQAK